jgi:hypothetical protein
MHATSCISVRGPLLRTHSVDRPAQRSPLVSSVPLNSPARGGRGDVERTLAICDAVRADRDDMVVKACSWALRELAMRDRVAVQKYLERRVDELPARVLREVRYKLETGLKNPPKRSSKTPKRRSV